MICLACGSENNYGAEKCHTCPHVFAVFPPYIKSNHICQLQAALRDCREGRLDLDGFGDRYTRFAEYSMDFQDRWKLGHGRTPLADRLAEVETLQGGKAQSPKELFLEGVKELDQSLGSLEEALASIDQALETGDMSLLTTADELLTDFFKIGCGGCAILIDELEKLANTQTDGFGAFLDVRGL